MKQFRHLAIAAALAGSGVLALAQTTIVSTQLRPIEEAEKMRNVILKGAPDAVNFVPEDPNTYLTRMKAELGATQGKVHVTIGLDGELGPVNALGGLQDLDDMVGKLGGSRQFSAAALSLGKLGGDKQRFVPLMTLLPDGGQQAGPALPACGRRHQRADLRAAQGLGQGDEGRHR
jgi:multiple sugar transport system substrate-binding protein